MPQTLPRDQFSSSLGQFFANEASGFFQQEESGVLISAIFISRQKLENYRITGQTHVHVCVTGAGKVQVPAAALGHVPKSLVRGWDRLIIAAAANLAISIGLARDRTSHFAQRIDIYRAACCSSLIPRLTIVAFNCFSTIMQNEDTDNGPSVKVADRRRA